MLFLFFVFACGDPAPTSDGGSLARDSQVERRDADLPFDAGAPVLGGPGCGLESAAFCETFDAIALERGRAGEADVRRFSASRANPQLPTGNGVAIAAGPATLPDCRGDLPATVFPPEDALVCDANAAIASKHLLVAVGAQNYGQNSYRIRQPFDFHGRTGRIVFHAEGRVLNGLLGWLSVAVTEDPTPIPSFSIGSPGQNNDEGGAVPRNGFEIHFQDNCGGRAEPGHFSVRFLDVITSFVDDVRWPEDALCVTGRQGHLNRFEIAVSRTRIEIYVSPHSEDGVTFAPAELMYAADVDLPFERGYVHLTVHNHATLKYGEDFGEGAPLDAWIARFDDIGFDGPVVEGWREHEIADSLVPGEDAWNIAGPVMSVGYLVADEADGPNDVFRFANVDPTGVTRARIALAAWYNLGNGDPPETFVLRYRLNGNEWHDRAFDADELAVLTNGHTLGAISQMLEVPVGELVAGENTLELTTRNVPQNYPPAVSSIDLVLEAP
jgi:hypothetical protein